MTRFTLSKCFLEIIAEFRHLGAEPADVRQRLAAKRCWRYRLPVKLAAPVALPLFYMR